MNKKLLAIGLIFVVLGITVALAVQLYKEYTFQQQATVGEVKFDAYLNDVLMTDGQTIQWGTALVPGETYTHTLKVNNIGDFDITIYLYLDNNFPSSWTQTWALNTTVIASGNQAQSDLVLTVASGATPQTYDWSCTLRGEQT